MKPEVKCNSCGWDGLDTDLTQDWTGKMQICPNCNSENIMEIDEPDEDYKPDIWDKADEAFEIARENEKPAYEKPIKPPEWWCDLYVDAAGNCFSDADPGL